MISGKNGQPSLVEKLIDRGALKRPLVCKKCKCKSEGSLKLIPLSYWVSPDYCCWRCSRCKNTVIFSTLSIFYTIL